MCRVYGRTIGVDTTQQVLVQAHLVEALKALLPVRVKLVLVVPQAAKSTGKAASVASHMVWAQAAAMLQAP